MIKNKASRISTYLKKNHFSSPIILHQICKRAIEIVLSKTFVFVDVDNFFPPEKKEQFYVDELTH